MKITIISSSFDTASRSERLAAMCLPLLREADGSGEYELIRLKDYPLPPFANDDVAMVSLENYQILHERVRTSDALILASPVYNWGCCAELKKFVEYIGSTNRSVRGAFYDKVITFVNAAGGGFSYMAFSSLAVSMMLDFKCIINPYNVYVHNAHWSATEEIICIAGIEEKEVLALEIQTRLKKSMAVTIELTRLLEGRSYRSGWEI